MEKLMNRNTNSTDFKNLLVWVEKNNNKKHKNKDFADYKNFFNLFCIKS